MKPEHQRGYMIIRHKQRSIAVTVNLSWFMSMPEWRRNKFMRSWDIVLIC